MSRILRRSRLLALPALLCGALVAALCLPAAGADARGADRSSVAVPAANPAAAGGKHTVTFDDYSFSIDSKRVYLWSGEFHYFRLPSPDLWADIFQKMRAAGFNTVSLYFDWGYHSGSQGRYDFSGIRDVDRLLDEAEAAGLYVIARPAPYINAEVDGGGFPGWQSVTKGRNRSDDPDYLEHADEWMTRIDAILAERQYTDGTGPVIAYQIENEYYDGSDAGRRYIQHMKDKARADGITVPLTGNNNGTFNAGNGMLDVDGPDAYPQGFNCSTPERWNGVPDLSYDHPAGRPLYTPEFQGGAFDPWGGPGYDKCAQLINDRFANVFSKQNIAVGATAQSLYMLYGGTNWGWLSFPQNYTSYDYGAAIRENRQLDPKYFEDKLIGAFTQSVAPLAKTDAIPAADPDNEAVLDTARRNPDDGTQFHVLRHRDSTSTEVDRTHVSLDFDAKPTGPASYTYDDTAGALQYDGDWSHVADQSYTVGDYQRTESFSSTAGDSVTIAFTGTAIRWIGSRTDNHGYADVYLDGVKQTRVDDSGSGTQAVLYQASGLADGQHTLKIVVAGEHSSGSTDDFVSIDAIDLRVPPAAGEPTYVVPQKPGTAITLDGRDSRVLTADYAMDGQRLRYSTSEIMTHATIGDRDVAVLYGNEGTDGETVLRYATKPTVTVGGGKVSTTWDPTTGDLRLNYTHGGLARVRISGGGTRPLLLLLADKGVATTFWRQDTAAGPVLVRGTHLLRTATSRGDGRTLALTGDNATNRSMEVFTSASRVRWNGALVRGSRSSTGSIVATIPTARRVALPTLTSWKYADGSPESRADFDDSRWQVADKTSSNSSTPVTTPTVLFADDYGFHTGNTWYRGRFATSDGVSGIHLASQSGGGAQAFSVWLNGTFVASTTAGEDDFTFPKGSLRADGDNVVSVLTVNMGHEEDYNSTNESKSARGLTDAALIGGADDAITWRVQGVRGGEDLIDPVRGPLSTGGLYGERAGWSLPGFPDSSWRSVRLPASSKRPGVGWYRTDVSLDLPEDQDTSVGLTFHDDPSRRYRAIVYVNGWHVGNYVNYLGPQHSFPVPNGILNPHGKNTIAVAVWNLDGSTGGLGRITLENDGTYTSPLRVRQNASPGYDARKYADPQ